MSVLREDYRGTSILIIIWYDDVGNIYIIQTSMYFKFKIWIRFKFCFIIRWDDVDVMLGKLFKSGAKQ